MLAYFPVPYNDELLYSIIARYAVHTGQVDNQKAVLRDVFGTTSAVAVPDFPSHLEILRCKASQIWKVTAKYIIKSHTMAPIYLPFLHTLQANRILKSMLSRQGGNIHTRCGISASSVPQPQHFRYCPACITEQLDTLGEFYWKREHHIPGVNVCSKHQCWLVSSELFFHPKQKHLYQPAELSCDYKKYVPAEISVIESRLLMHFQELLNLQCLNGHTHHQWTLFYQNLAMQVGLKRGGRIDHSGIRGLLLADWGNTEYSAHLKQGNESDWLTNIFRKHRKSFHPLRHIMVWCSFLPRANVEKIISSIEKLPKNEPHKTVVVTPCGDSRDPSTQEKRSTWLNILAQNNGCGIKIIRKTPPGGAVYAWLYRNDRAWLMANRPHRVRKDGKGCQVDYASWDQETVATLKELKLALNKTQDRQRLSRTYYIKQLPRSNSVEKHQSDLPATNRWLELNAESLEDYQLFRITKAADFLRDHYLPIKKWRLLRLAGVRAEAVTVSMNRLFFELEAQKEC